MTPITAINDFVIKFANVNGSGSASANDIVANPPRFSFSRLREKVPKADEGVFDISHVIATKKPLTRPFGPPSPEGRGEKHA